MTKIFNYAFARHSRVPSKKIMLKYLDLIFAGVFLLILLSQMIG